MSKNTWEPYNANVIFNYVSGNMKCMRCNETLVPTNVDNLNAKVNWEARLKFAVEHKECKNLTSSNEQQKKSALA